MGTNCLNSYIVNPYDTTHLGIRRKEHFYGMVPYEPVSFDNSYLNFKYEVLQSKKIVDNSTIPDYAYDQSFVRESAALWNRLGIRLRSVPILTDRYDITKFNGYVTQDFVNAIEVGSPLQIPTFYLPGGLEVSYSYTINTNLYGRNVSICTNINLPQMNRRAVSAIYAHEITHMQMYNAGGGALRITNDETLPIMMEEIAADMIDGSGETFTLIRNNRMHHIANSIETLKSNNTMTVYQKMQFDDYIISGIQGINLANIYLLGDINLKREMIGDINRVFSGDMVTEEILDKYDSNVSDIPKRVKALTRYKR